MTRGRAALAVVVLATGPAHAGTHVHHHRATPGAVVSPAELGWPATTRTVEVRTRAKIYAEPHHHRLGQLAVGTRVELRRVVAGRGSCRAWVELEPIGFACASDVAPSDQPPFAVAQPVDRPVHHHAGLRPLPPPSTFAGFDVGAVPPLQWPFAWVVSRHPDRDAGVFDAPGGSPIGTEPSRAVVPVLAERDGFVQIAAGRWIAVEDARIARLTAAPSGVAADERWIDVDLDQEVLIAYTGATPSYATLVSTGHGHTGTPTGISRIESKVARTRMTNPVGTPASWDVVDVPWAMRYRKNFALHGVYWHDAFGQRRSHGCVNVAPRDASWLYRWTLPAVPDGWFEVKASAGAGTAIRVRSHNHPDPPWVSFAGDRLTASGAAPRPRAR